jgi:hypothetical protein
LFVKRREDFLAAADLSPIPNAQLQAIHLNFQVGP